MSSSVLDYLTNVLSQRGPNAVPYGENVKWNVRDHVSELQKVFPTLTSKLSEYHSNDGRLLHVLKVEGTMPIHYQGSKYNIPILMWLTEQYPYAPPQVYVVPTSNMIVRPSNMVDPSGQVATPLLRSWIFPSSNLVDVVLEMSQRFGEEPPLYTRPGGYTPPPTSHGPAIGQPTPNYPHTHVGPSPNPSPASVATAAAASGTYPAAQYPGIQGATAGTLTPYATPSVGNTPNSTPGAGATFSGSSGSNWGPPAAVAAPSPAYPSASGAVHPPPPPPPPPHNFGLGSIFFGGLFGNNGQQQPQPTPPPPPPPSHPPSTSQFSAQGPLSQPTPPPPPPPEPQRPTVSREELDVHFRHLAIEALSGQLRTLQRGFNEYAQEETTKALEVQNQLSERKGQLQAVYESLTKERMSTEHLVAELDCETKALQAWLSRNEPIANKFDPESSPVSNYLLPVDDMCRQGMETQARDLAVEDAILALDKLLQTGQVPLDAYLKQVRSLCRKQFFSRALGLKVAAVQQQVASTRPAPPQPSPNFQSTPYPIAHGDGWSHGAPPPPLTGLHTPSPLVPQVGLAPGQAPRVPSSTGVGLGPGLMSPSTGMLMNPLAGR